MKPKLIPVPICSELGCNNLGTWDGKCIDHRTHNNWQYCSEPECPLMTVNITGRCLLHRGTKHKARTLKLIDRMYTTGETATVCGVSTRTIRRWVSEDRVRPSRTVGGHMRFTARQIKKLVSIGDETHG